MYQHKIINNPSLNCLKISFKAFDCTYAFCTRELSIHPPPTPLPTMSVHINEPITEWIQPKTVPYNNWLSNYLIKQQSKLTWTEQMVHSHKHSLHTDKLHWGNNKLCDSPIFP